MSKYKKGRIPKNIEYIIDSNNCFICTSHTKNKQGYIKINRQGHYLMHRLILEEKLGRSIKEDYCACHLCDNPSCINPNHLEEHTKEWNNKDRTNKKRGIYLGNGGPPKRNFKAISPEGIIYYSNNQHEFAREHNLNRNNILSCLNGRLKSCNKGWRFNYE